jgi:hypothetical protein
MKLRGKVSRASCDNYNEEEDGTVSDVVEIIIYANDEKELNAIRDGMQCTVKFELTQKGKR